MISSGVSSSPSCFSFFLNKNLGGCPTHSQWASPPLHLCIGGANAVGQAILVHHPTCLHTLGSAALVEDEGFLHTNLVHRPTRRVHRSVGARGLPIPWRGCSVRPGSIRVFSVPGAEEIPFAFSKNGLPCNNNIWIGKEGKSRVLMWPLFLNGHLHVSDTW